MNISDLKLKLFRQIDALDKKSLEEAYGILLNYFNSRDNTADWNNLSPTQQNGLIEAIEQLDNGKGISQEEVFAKYRKKYDA